MGQSRAKRARFLEQHPLCCFCGGGRAAETIDHVPARTFFAERIGPEGLEFPACRACNGATKASEQIVGTYARLFDYDERNYRDGEVAARLQALKNNASEMLPNINLTANEKRAALRKLGMAVPAGTFLDDLPMTAVPVEFRDHVKTVGRKLICALHYKHRERPVPLGQSLMVTWTQTQLPGTAELAKLLRRTLPTVHVGTRRNTDIGDQFAYAWGLNEGEDLFALAAQFGQGLLLICAAGRPALAQESRHAEEWVPHIVSSG